MTDAAIASEQIAQGIFSKIDNLVKKLQTSADGGNKEARDKLNFLHWDRFQAFKKDLERKARAGEHGWPPPIRTILEMADFAIPLLLWLTEHQRENVKGYARERWTWPGYFHLLKKEQSRYQDLLPEFNQVGTKIIRASRIELGKNLGLNLNANLTNGDYLFLISANAVFEITNIEETKKRSWGFPWQWIVAHGKEFEEPKGSKVSQKAENFLLSLGKFTRKNWLKWKPVFDTYLTFYFAPPEIKFEKLPKYFQENVYLALQTGTEKQWLENHKKTHPLNAVEETEWLDYLQKSSQKIEILQDSNHPEIRAIGGRTERTKWNAIKRELLNRIFKLAPKD
jgi:hypothetical protein